MWIFTVDGYYSAVEDKDDPSRIMVRSRQESDLKNLIKRLDREDLDLLVSTDSDYAFRIFIPRELWISYLESSGQELNYTNFKARAIAPGDHCRYDTYHNIWRELKNWQDKGIR